MRVLPVFLAIMLGLATMAQAQAPTSLKRMITGDDSRGWEAVGRLDFGHNAFCTGALIAPDLVLTAAHCLYDPQTKRRIAPEDIRFLAGWRNGRASAYRGVRAAIPHPDFVFLGMDRVTRVSSDVALLKLDQPVRNFSITPFQTAGRPRKGDEVGVVSYAQDRADNPSLQEVCAVLARQSGTLILSCEVDFGSSGAPVFAIGEDGVARIVSVISAKSEVDGMSVALGTSLEEPLAELRALLAASVASEPQAAAGPRLLSTTGNQGGGAKFLRP